MQAIEDAFSVALNPLSEVAADKKFKKQGRAGPRCENILKDN
jgi:hypothetical protein